MLEKISNQNSIKVENSIKVPNCKDCSTLICICLFSYLFIKLLIVIINSSFPIGFFIKL